MSGRYFTREQWFSMPLAMRRRWWKETDFGKIKPSAELLIDVIAAIGENNAPKRSAPISEAQP